MSKLDLTRFSRLAIAAPTLFLVSAASADMALLLKEERSGFVPNHSIRNLSCRIEPNRVTKTTTIGFFTRTESFDIHLDAMDSLSHLMQEAQHAGITDYGMAPTDIPTVSWSASLNSEGDLKLGGIESGRYFYNESEAANALRFMIDSMCGSIPEPRSH